MAFDNRAKTTLPANDPLARRPEVIGSAIEVPDIIANNPQMPLGRRERQTIKWRVPGLGYVEMYINPQQMTISERKIINKQRTKGGYVVQYWGEETIAVKIAGNTGASGIEGINILRKVYRAEQDAFQQVAQSLAQRLSEQTTAGVITGAITGAAESGIGAAYGGILNAALGGSQNPPLLPTLGSLATSIELFFQGWVMKGYFESFSVDESVTNGVGVFTYNMDFVVLDRRGRRSNFEPWHKLPATVDAASGKPTGYYKADTNSTPLNFRGEE